MFDAFTVQHSLHSIHCTAFTAQHSLHSIHCTKETFNLNEQTSYPKILWLLTRAIALAALVALIFTAAPASAQDPDFDTIDDPLNGEYELFTVDDLLIMRSKAVNNNTTPSCHD
jgi:hypothetical protein